MSETKFSQRTSAVRLLLALITVVVGLAFLANSMRPSDGVPSDTGYDEERLRQLKSENLGDILFLTFDDLAESLAATINVIENL